MGNYSLNQNQKLMNGSEDFPIYAHNMSDGKRAFLFFYISGQDDKQCPKGCWAVGLQEQQVAKKYYYAKENGQRPACPDFHAGRAWKNENDRVEEALKLECAEK